MLDSGAFAVWNRGKSIDLGDYIKFCLSYPGCTNYVALDVIPGKPGYVPKPADREKSCQMSWDNYQRMLKSLPFEKVIPVFHQNEDFKWLEKYIDFGTPYVGISPANDKTTGQKIKWLKEVEKYIFDSSGQPIIKTHGFAVTAFKLMKMFKWHSVDSASWIRVSSYGKVYVPHEKAGEFLYDIAPTLLSCSPKSPAKDDKHQHIDNLNRNPLLLGRVDRWFDEVKVKRGQFEMVEVEEGYKKGKGELKFEGKKEAMSGFVKAKVPKKQVLRVLKKGVITCHQTRFWVNKIFLERANEVLPVDHIYFAGAAGSLADGIEFKLKKRLFSYYDLMNNKSAMKAFEGHFERV